jgi:hypothetical protein
MRRSGSSITHEAGELSRRTESDMLRILRHQFYRRSYARIRHERLEHGLDVDVRGGSDYRSGPDIPGTQTRVKSGCSARVKLNNLAVRIFRQIEQEDSVIYQKSSPHSRQEVERSLREARTCEAQTESSEAHCPCDAPRCREYQF